MNNYENYLEVESLDDNTLILFCNEIFQYQNGSGDLARDMNFYIFFKNHQSKYNWDIRYFIKLIIDLAIMRFDSIVKLLMINRPHCFIKHN